ncbi:MAG: hypothetical protein FD149_2664 [Rhodospirillaceae bacterium]|nr:MAG: hypothetical protein FD149_2664 [Rhodospirillaceae bacterium]
MNRSSRFIIRMLLFLAVVLGGVVLLFPALHRIFLANPFLNGLIVAVIVMGIGINFRTVWLLIREERWLDAVRHGSPFPSNRGSLRLLTPMVHMLGEQGAGLVVLSAVTTRSLLESIAARLEEVRDISRYFVGLCIFLGLLGTFWGLLETVTSIGSVIGTLSIGGDDMTLVFDNLKQGLEKPLAGMGTAFSSSLLGLSGSLVIGFLDLQSGQAQNSFHNRLEDWLAGQTRLVERAGAEHPPVPAYIQALLEQAADNVSELARTLTRGQEGQTVLQNTLRTFTDTVATLTDYMKTQQGLLERLASHQTTMQALLETLTRNTEGANQVHLRNLDHAVGHLAEESIAGRERLIQEVRSEIRLLARTIAMLAEEADDRQT